MFAQTPNESNYRTPAPSLSPATFVTHLVAGVPLLKVGVGPSNGAEPYAVPLYRRTCVLTASLPQLPGGILLHIT